MRSTAVVVVAILTGCLPSYRYEQPSLPRGGATPEEQCYQSQRLELVPGHASWREQHQSGDYLITNHFGSSGLAFYRGGQRLGPELAMADLDDPELAAAYRRLLADNASDHVWYPRYRNAAFGMALGGLGIALLTLAQVATTDDPDVDSAMTGVWLAAGLAVFSIIPTYLAYRTHDGAIRHDIDSRMVTDGNLAKRAAESTDLHNASIANRCGL